MPVGIGTRVTLANGDAGTVVEKAHYLGGQYWRCVFRDADLLGSWAVRLVREDAFSTTSDPASYEVGDRVRIGLAGPVGEVTAVVSGDPTLYEVSRTTYSEETRTPVPSVGVYEAFQLVARA